MSVYGISHGIYWLSWIIMSICFSLFLSIYTILLGYAFQFKFFLDTNFIILFFLFFFFTFSMQTVSYFLSSLVSTLRQSNSISYGFILFAIVIELFISSPNLICFFYADKKEAWVSWLLFFLSQYPPFNYSKMFADISFKSGYHWDHSKRM